MTHKQSYTLISPWEKFRNILKFIKVIFGGDKFEWNIDLKKATRPVLLIHGFATPRQCMATMENRLKADGYDVFGFRLGPANLLGVDKAARIISIKIKNLARTHGLKKIAIVGHSLGGIIGRAYVSLRKGSRNCHTLITLGSPHKGHPAGRWSRHPPIVWFTHAPRDLAPGSEIMKQLEENPIPPNVYTVSIFSSGDHICPREICEVDIPHGSKHLANIHVDGVNHVDFFMDPRIYAIVRKHLEEGFRRNAEAEPDPDETLPT